VVELGGLYVLGTERHESRRIDNQLRGRSGRQGDPGETRFYLSGEDDLVRLFAGDRIKSIMERFNIPDDQPMEAKILSRQIEGAQKKVEEQNFVMRKNVLKYDDVLNRHRGRIYEQRRQVLEGEDMSEQVKLWIDEIVEETVNAFTAEGFSEEWDLEALTNAMAQLYGTDVTVSELVEDGVDVTDRQALIEEFQSDARAVYEEKEKEFGVTGENGDGPPLMRELERFVILQVVDVRWREHLENMDYLREGVGLRSMAQKDPLVEYTAEGERMFTELGRAIRGEVVLHLFHAELAPEEAQVLQQQPSQTTNGRLQYEHETAAGAAAIAAAGSGEAVMAGVPSAAGVQTVYASEHEKLGRNDPCWCGSGKKFKKCHGA
jgi:preprotein translocase subunit SecA